MAGKSLFSNLLFAMIQSMYWSAFCLTSTFMVLYLKSRGYEDGQIGALLSIGSLALLLGQYFWGAYCYKYAWLSHKAIVVACFLVGAAVNGTLPWIASQYVLVLTAFALFSFTYASTGPMIDSWTMFRKKDAPGLNYGITRGAGSAAYACVALYFGHLANEIGLEKMFFFAILFIVLGLLTAAFIPAGNAEQAGQIRQAAGFRSTGKLMSNIRFLLLSVAVLIVFTAYTASVSFYGVLITKLGGTSGDFGKGMALAAWSQVPLMMLSSWLLRRFRAQLLLLISFLAFVGKALLLASAAQLDVAVYATLADSISFGLFLPACMAYLEGIVRKGEMTFAYMLISAASFGLGGMLGNFIGGFTSEYAGLFRMYDYAVWLTAVGAAVVIVSLSMRQTPSGGYRN